MLHSKSFSKLWAGLTAIFLISTGCSINDNASTGPKPVNVNMQITGATAPKAATSTATSTGHVTLTSVKLLVEELELESVADDSMDFEIENQVVELPLDGSPYQLSTANIASGLYDEFEMEVEGLDDDDSVNDPDFTEGSDETSIVIKGTYDGQDFTFKSEEDFEIEFEFNPPIEIDETTNSVDINLMVDISSWFIDDAGNELDPTDPANREQIDDNIENSFEAYDDIDDEDDDEDDDDDDDDDDSDD